MKKKILTAVILCVIAAAIVVLFAVKHNSGEKPDVSADSETSSAELITDAVEIKRLLDKCIEENGYELGTQVFIDSREKYIADSSAYDIVVVKLSVNYERRDEIESWDSYFKEIREAVEKCIDDSNIDKNYVIIDQLD
jgi:hypothetical protein